VWDARIWQWQLTAVSTATWLRVVWYTFANVWTTTPSHASHTSANGGIIIPPNGGSALPHYKASQPRQRNCELVFYWREVYPFKAASVSSLLSNTPWFPEEHNLLEGSQHLPIWSGNNTYVQTNTGSGGMTLRGENRRARRKPCPSTCPPHISHGMTWDRNRTSVVTGRRPTATAMTRHWKTINLNVSP